MRERLSLCLFFRHDLCVRLADGYDINAEEDEERSATLYPSESVHPKRNNDKR